MVMDFQEFARQFSERTAQRLIEFEATVDQAQRSLEKMAKNTPGTQPGVSQEGAVVNDRRRPARPVQSILRRQ